MVLSFIPGREAMEEVIANRRLLMEMGANELQGMIDELGLNEEEL